MHAVVLAVEFQTATKFQCANGDRCRKTCHVGCELYAFCVTL